MTRRIHSTPIICFAIGCCLCSGALAQTDRTAEDVLRDLARLQAPELDPARRDDAEYVGRMREAQAAYLRARADLAKELYTIDPASLQARQLMIQRWRTLTGQPADQAEMQALLEETAAAAAGDDDFATEASYAHAAALGASSAWADPRCPEAIDTFIARAPTDERGLRLLRSLGDAAPDSATRVAAYRRALELYPDARASEFIPGRIRQVEQLGKPFELSFSDAITGETIDLQARRGAIFVLDFWATWCGPCIRELPHMKELYAQFKDNGVEFIGVSLDQPEDKGGLEKLRAFVEQNELPWPHYYQGNYWDSEFSKSWGVNSIPCLFVIDHEGALHSTDARGRLETILPELIARRDGQN